MTKVIITNFQIKICLSKVINLIYFYIENKLRILFTIQTCNKMSFVIFDFDFYHTICNLTLKSIYV